MNDEQFDNWWLNHPKRDHLEGMHRIDAFEQIFIELTESSKGQAVLSNSTDGLTGEHCEWQYEGIQEYWETGCAMEYIILEGSPGDNGMVYCTYCGRKINTAC